VQLEVGEERGTPEGLSVDLLPHQRKALHWMRSIEMHPLGSEQHFWISHISPLDTETFTVWSYSLMSESVFLDLRPRTRKRAHAQLQGQVGALFRDVLVVHPYFKVRGGWISEEMGLGKTVQAAVALVFEPGLFRDVSLSVSSSSSSHKVWDGDIFTGISLVGFTK
jgi:SNF2 family DNA or RNA helicase